MFVYGVLKRVRITAENRTPVVYATSGLAVMIETIFSISLVAMEGGESPVYAFMDDVHFTSEDNDNDTDYVPDSQGESNDSDLDFRPIGLRIIPAIRSKQISSKETVSTLSDEVTKDQRSVPDDSIPSTSINKQVSNKEMLSTSCAEVTKIQGLVLDDSIQGKSVTKRDKQHYCVFCGIPQSKLSRHLKSRHKDESEMIPYLNATLRTKADELAKLRNGGNHLHNIQTLKSGEGTVVVKRRKRKQTDVGDFIPCHKCLGYFHKKDLWRHKCIMAAPENAPKKQLVRKGRLLLPDQGKGTDLLREILETMKKDQVYLVLKGDFLIKLMGERQCKKNGFDKDRYGGIRNKLRELGRLLIAIRKVTKTECGSLAHFLQPQYFRAIVEATKEVASFKEDSIVNPSIAMKLGHSLKQCCLLLKAHAIETGDHIQREKCDGYMELHTIQWNEEISNLALRTTYQKKKNNIKRIPLAEDIATLTKYLTDVAMNTMREMKANKESTELRFHWARLAEVTLTQIILFNRRRQGEASKMKIEDFSKGKTTEHSSDIINELSEFEKALCKAVTRIEITGKRGRLVPVLMTASMKESVELLISERDKVDILPSNKFIFARINNDSDGHIRGSDTLRKLAGEVSLKHPECITSTTLRKHIATMTQLLNLKDNELDLIAQFMGHDIRIHREHYRLPSSTMQVAKVSKLLLAMEKGSLSLETQDLDNIQADDVIEECDNDNEDGFVESEDDEGPTPDEGGDEEYSGSNHAGSKQITVSTSNSEIHPASQGRRDMTGRRKWSSEEETACLDFFQRSIALQKLPGKSDILRCQELVPSLQDRTWIQIKNFVRNHIKKVHK